MCDHRLTEDGVRTLARRLKNLEVLDVRASGYASFIRRSEFGPAFGSRFGPRLKVYTRTRHGRTYDPSFAPGCGPEEAEFRTGEAAAPARWGA